MTDAGAIPARLTQEQFGRLVAGLFTPQQRALIRELHERVGDEWADRCPAHDHGQMCCVDAFVDNLVVTTPKLTDPCTRNAGGCHCTLRPGCQSGLMGGRRMPALPPWGTALVAGLGNATAAAAEAEQEAAKRAAIRGEPEVDTLRYGLRQAEARPLPDVDAIEIEEP